MTTNRLAPIASTDVEDEKTRKLLSWLERHGKDVHMAHLFANVPEVFPSYLSMSDALLNRSVLPGRLRELAILRLGRRLDAEYEWWEHVRMSQADGVTAAEHDALLRGDAEAGCFDDADRCVLAIADDWVDNEWRLSDEVWRRGEATLGRDALVELVFVLAWWGAWVPAVVRAFGIEVPSTEGGSQG